MFRMFLTGWLGRHVARFISAERGNIAVIFAICLVPILAFIGSAIDYTRAVRARSAMQAALDSTVLMLSKDLTSSTISASEIATKTQSYFNALYNAAGVEAQGVSVNSSYTPASGATSATILLNGSGFIVSDFMQIAGFPKLGFSTTSATTWGNVKMRVALALDNTGSMASDGKMTALRNAVAGSGGLIDQLSALSKTNGDVYISLVPFAKVVNVNSTNSSQSWIDWTDWLNPPTSQPANGSYQAALPMNWHAVGPGAKCPFTNSNDGFTCTSSPTSSTNASYIPSLGSYTGYICPSVDYNSHSLYNGCWVSTAAGTGVFCSGSASCSCPVSALGLPVLGCSCTGSGGGKSCTGSLYTHNWTQPGPNDLSDNRGQPRVSAPVGFVNNKWTATSSTPTVANDWRQASTNSISTWTGCVTDRTQPNDATGVLPSSYDLTTLLPANEYYENSTAYCSSSVSNQLQPLVPLSYSWSTLKSAVNAMQPTGGTNQAIGLSMAWQSLLVGGPFSTPSEDASTTFNRVIILLSDGLNTEDRWPEYGNGSSQASGNPIDARQTALCTNLKNAKDSQGRSMYTIYTIQVNTSSPADPTSSVLQNCASSPDKFFMLTSATQIVTTFNTIGTALSKLRIAR